MLQRRAGDVALPWYDLDWEQGEGPVEVAEALDERLRSGGRLTEAKAFDFALAVRNLQAGLRLALVDQHAQPGTERLRGQLREALQSGWVVTTEGVQNLDTGFAASGEELGFDRGSSVFGPTWSVPRRFSMPPPPAGVPLPEWELVVERARAAIGTSSFF